MSSLPGSRPAAAPPATTRLPPVRPGLVPPRETPAATAQGARGAGVLPGEYAEGRPAQEDAPGRATLPLACEHMGAAVADLARPARPGHRRGRAAHGRPHRG